MFPTAARLLGLGWDGKPRFCKNRKERATRNEYVSVRGYQRDNENTVLQYGEAWNSIGKWKSKRLYYSKFEKLQSGKTESGTESWIRWDSANVLQRVLKGHAEQW